jgi:hypothetical protein
MGWINVKDTRPKSDGTFLVTDGEHVTMGEWYVKGGWSLSREDKAVGVFPDSITHWMPLPAPPKTSQRAQRDPPASKK